MQKKKLELGDQEDQLVEQYFKGYKDIFSPSNIFQSTSQQGIAKNASIFDKIEISRRDLLGEEQPQNESLSTNTISTRLVTSQNKEDTQRGHSLKPQEQIGKNKIQQQQEAQSEIVETKGFVKLENKIQSQAKLNGTPAKIINDKPATTPLNTNNIIKKESPFIQDISKIEPIEECSHIEMQDPNNTDYILHTAEKYLGGSPEEITNAIWDEEKLDGLGKIVQQYEKSLVDLSNLDAYLESQNYGKLEDLKKDTTFNQFVGNFQKQKKEEQEHEEEQNCNNQGGFQVDRKISEKNTPKRINSTGSYVQTSNEVKQKSNNSVLDDKSIQHDDNNNQYSCSSSSSSENSSSFMQTHSGKKNKDQEQICSSRQYQQMTSEAFCEGRIQTKTEENMQINNLSISEVAAPGGTSGRNAVQEPKNNDNKQTEFEVKSHYQEEMSKLQKKAADTEQRNQQLTQMLLAFKQKIADVASIDSEISQSLTSLAQENRRLQEQLRETRNSSNSNSASNSQKEQEIIKREKNLKRKENMLKEQTDEIKRREQIIQEKENILEKKEQEIQIQLDEQYNNEGILHEKELQIQEEYDKITRLNQDCENRVQLCCRREQELSMLSIQLGKREKALKEVKDGRQQDGIGQIEKEKNQKGVQNNIRKEEYIKQSINNATACLQQLENESTQLSQVSAQVLAAYAPPKLGPQIQIKLQNTQNVIQKQISNIQLALDSIQESFQQ